MKGILLQLARFIRRDMTHIRFVKQRQRSGDAVRRMAAMNLPVADWEQMERESTA